MFDDKISEEDWLLSTLYCIYLTYDEKEAEMLSMQNINATGVLRTFEVWCRLLQTEILTRIEISSIS